MAKTRKIILIILCVALFLVAAAFALLAAVDFDYSNIGGGKAEKKTINIKNSYSSIEIEEITGNVNVIVANYGDNRVEGYEKGGIYTEVTADTETSTLKVSFVDEREWYEKIFVNSSDMIVNVYIPKDGFESIKIKNTSGSVTVESGFEANLIKISTVSGNVDCGSAGAQATNIATTSGDIEFSGEKGGELNVATTSGNISFFDVNVTNIKVSSVSGNISCGMALASSEFNAETTSGDVEFVFISANKLTIKTSSGDINGALAGGKKITAKTTSGKITLPENTVSGNDVILSTVSRDIKITEFGKE